MKRITLPTLGAAIIATAAVSGCGGGDSMSSSMPASQPPMSQAMPPPVIDFTAFVKALLADRSETAAPMAVNPGQFAFPDDDNPGAFSTVLPGT
jgi:hypothetical protein